MQFILSALGILELHVVRKKWFYTAALITGVVLAIPAWFLVVPAPSFPEGILIEVTEDASAGETIALLKENGLITSEVWVKGAARISGADRDFHAGRYQFTEPISALEILYRLAHGISGIPVIRVTFPEGMTSYQMAERLADEIPGFDGAAFEALARQQEGYLFPDTYDFYGDTTPEEAVERMADTFEEKTKELQETFSASGRTLDELVIMASIIEREADTLEDRRMIAGILWSRIEVGVALQVDAVFGYIKGTDTFHPSFEDLEEDSPYNTYRNRGLPPGAISNPGLDSLIAAATPIASDYFYYLTGRDGVMYYAEDFEEHKRNRELYLD